ncbi:MAG: hypothetical protein CMB78_04235 [Euryarchaeota archaeon]|nr:hypothetical protein [Euryarchaeota archaeon]
MSSERAGVKSDFPRALSGCVALVDDKIVIDTETWGARELFEVICSRYFELGNEGAYPPSWEVDGVDGQDVSSQLTKLNQHIESMGMVGSLDESNPPVLSISKLPPSRDVMAPWQQMLLWGVMALFLTSVGSFWISAYGHGSNPAGVSPLFQALLYFSMPIILTLIIASNLRLKVARWFDVEIGHIVPIVLPIPSWWAFGIAGALGQKRVDLTPIPSRRALGSIELVVPLVLFLSGTILTVAGLLMTPSYPPDLERSPVIFDTNLLSGSILDSWLEDEVAIRLQWLHPMGIAGIGLSIVGWGLILPIPGLPGDRLLQSILGPSETMKGSTQTSIFLASLFVMVVVFATAKWTPWVFLAFVAAWQRFNPDGSNQPLVLDEHSRLDDHVRSRFVAIAAIILFAGLPAPVPSLEMESYDSGISTSEWPEELQFSTGDEKTLNLDLKPEGVLPVSGWVQIRIEGADADNWELSWPCSENSASCRFQGVTQTETKEFSLTITPPEGDILPHLLIILLEIPGFEKEHVILMTNSSQVGPKDPFWSFNGDSESPLICSDILIGEEGGNITIEDSYWYFSSDSNMTPGLQEVCLEGHPGAIQRSSNQDKQGRAYAPGLILRSGNDTFGPWRMAIHDSGNRLQVDGEWLVPEGFAANGSVLIHSDLGSAFCPSREVIAEVDTDSNWSYKMENYSAVRLTGGFLGKGSLWLGTTGWLAVCNEESMVQYRIEESVDVFISPGGIESGLNDGNFWIHNRDQRILSVSVEMHGDSTEGGIWDVDYPNEIINGSVAMASAISDGRDDLERSIWVSADSFGVIIHLSARCPVGGC